MLPLHEAALDPDEAWGVERTIRCGCGAEIGLWQKRCRGCKRRNPFPRLGKRRQRLERWIDRRVARELMPEMLKGDLLPSSQEAFLKILAEVIRRPVAERQSNEDLGNYLRRLGTFFPNMFKATSPARFAREVDDKLSRTAQALARTTVATVAQWVKETTGLTIPRTEESVVEQQVERLKADLGAAFRPVAEALKVLQSVHDRMVGAWAPVRPLFQRTQEDGALKATWNKMREFVRPVGRVFRFGSAIWQSDAEREALERLETEMVRFHEQIGRFEKASLAYPESRARQEPAWRLSLRKHLVARLVEGIAQAPAAERLALVEKVLAHRGVGGFWFRWRYRRRHRWD